MTWTVGWKRRAVGDLRVLDRQVAQRVIEAVERFATTGHGDVRRLHGIDEYRLRVGDWRIRFALDTATRTLTVLRVLRRDEAYR